MPLKAGTTTAGTTTVPDQYANSMAAAMEIAFKNEWKLIMKSDPPPSNDHMKLLFIAVAQGVVKHLIDQQKSFTVTVPSGGGTNIAVAIATEGTLYT